MQKITPKDFTELDLGDIRRNERFTAILNNVIGRSGQSIPQQNENWYGAKATYSFFNNADIALESLQRAIHAYGTSSVGADMPCVLIPHDTSNVSYNNSSAQGLGYLDNKLGKGFLLHSSLAVSQDGIPLGLLHQQIWTIKYEELGKAKSCKAKPIEEKESSKWLKGVAACNKQLGGAMKKIHIADREADVYELFFLAPQDDAELLIRAFRPRKTDEGDSLWQQIGQLPVNAVTVLEIPDAVSHKKVSTQVEIRYQKVKLLCPRAKKNKYDSIELMAIEVRQPGVDDEQNGVWWKLLTTMEVRDIEDVKRYVRWYTYRWLIERFHYVLKSGCQVESLQLKQAAALGKAIAIYSLAAFKIMQLTYLSRENGGVSCEVVLSKVEWQALYARTHRTTELPKTPPNLHDATKWIGKMGGHLGRKSDGPPGLKAIWRGYRKLQVFLEAYLIMTEQNLGND